MRTGVADQERDAALGRELRQSEDGVLSDLGIGIFFHGPVDLFYRASAGFLRQPEEGLASYLAGAVGPCHLDQRVHRLGHRADVVSEAM